MPVISYFFGIYVRMYFDDHLPPHFHAEYQGAEALIAIDTGEMIEGRLPKKSGQNSQGVVLRAPSRAARQLAACGCASAAEEYSGS